MSIDALDRPLSVLARPLNALQSLLALFARLYVSWQFFKSGWLKVTSWDATVDLFRTEYHVPLLPPVAAAVSGATGELFFSVLIILGLGGRIGPLGLFCVNIMAVVSYRQVLLSEGFEAALAQHVLWGFMLIMLAVYGLGQLSLDRLIARAKRRDYRW